MLKFIPGIEYLARFIRGQVTVSGIEWGIGGLLASIIYGGGSAFLVWDLGNGGLTTAILVGGGVF